MRAIPLLALASVALAGMSGTYTVKPDGTGDFLGFWEAGESLMTYGISGDCVFEAYNGNCRWMELAVVATDTFTLTFRPAEGQDSARAEMFEITATNNVKVTGLEFLEDEFIIVRHSAGMRIEGCRVHGIELDDDCTYDSVMGNDLHYLVMRGGYHLATNNFLRTGEGTPAYGADLGEAYRSRFAFNTIYGLHSDISACLCIQCTNSARNNIMVLGPWCGPEALCILPFLYQGETLDCDYNCYLVESLGYVAEADTWLDFAGWQALGYEAHGMYANPRFIDSTDLHLREGSPCIGAGVPIPGIVTDIDGDPRDPAHPDIGADEFTGGAVEERTTPDASRMTHDATIVCGSLLLLPSLLATHCSLLTPDGRKVLDLLPGSNDVHRLAPGVYFVREEPQAPSLKPQAVRKVVVTG